MWVGEGAADLFQPGMHGSTFGGTPLACAAALAVLDVLEREGLVAHVARESVPWIRDLRLMAGDFPGKVLEVRGLGFLVGVQMASDSAPTIAALREHGLLIAPAGVNVIRLLPPLDASAAELARSVEIFREVLSGR
jgi:acetylornithine aminotransferase/acetylornithine/N-succinyldiaminopimelate aminotransferase